MYLNVFLLLQNFAERLLPLIRPKPDESTVETNDKSSGETDDKSTGETYERREVIVF